MEDALQPEARLAGRDEGPLGDVNIIPFCGALASFVFLDVWIAVSTMGAGSGGNGRERGPSFPAAIVEFAEDGTD